MYIIVQCLFMAKQSLATALFSTRTLREMAECQIRSIDVCKANITADINGTYCVHPVCLTVRYFLCVRVFDRYFLCVRAWCVCMCVATKSLGACSDQIHDGFLLNRPPVAINRFFYVVLDGFWKFLGRKKSGIRSEWIGLRESKDKINIENSQS